MVKAHQDDNHSYDQLDSWAKANVMADKLAEDHMQRILDQMTPRYQRRKEDGWIICTAGNIATQHFDSALTLHYTKHSAQENWCNRMNSLPADREAVDWDIFMKTTTQLLPHQQLFITKHCAGISATGEQTISPCPQCHADNEHGEHIVLCASKSAHDTFLTAFTELGLWLQKTTSFEIQTAITNIVWAHRNGLELDPNEYENTPVTEALKVQLSIGTYPFLCRLLSTQLVEVQQTHINEKASRRCRKKQAAQLCIKMIEIIQDMWTDQNNILQKNDNIVKEEENMLVNRLINDIHDSMPSNTCILTAAE